MKRVSTARLAFGVGVWLCLSEREPLMIYRGCPEKLWSDMLSERISTFGYMPARALCGVLQWYLGVFGKTSIVVWRLAVEVAPALGPDAGAFRKVRGSASTGASEREIGLPAFANSSVTDYVT
ncbi:hypothetical protein FB567DRAFT_158555 [Paraphoma chrysanthemicola]|uniref:Secreted protein n=1 Tax=Paraphoma chrysanthemicola TaxID=798071 RepID=A0A8K0W2N8_9PLEO|nr:hypothetical protein FB567DRAFT_158555 [Paraphoma chrysanthemicola]